MFVARAAAVGGFVLLVVMAPAQFPIIPRKVYLKLESLVFMQKILQGHGTPVGTNLNAKVTHGKIATSQIRRDGLVHWLDKNICGTSSTSAAAERWAIHAVNVSGDTTAYDEATNYGEGGQTFTDDGAISITGRKVLGVLSVQADIPDSRLSDPTTQNYLLEYDQGPLEDQRGRHPGLAAGGQPAHGVLPLAARLDDRVPARALAL